MSNDLVRGLTMACALAAAAAAPFAQAAQRGLYLGGGAGLYTLEIDDLEFDDDAALLRAFGGFRFSDHWAVEADYQYLSEAKDAFLGQDVELDFEGYGISVRPILPLGDRLDLYGRIGWTWYDAEASIAGVGIDGSDDDFTWGGGVDFHLGDLLTLRGEVSRIEVDDTDLSLVSAAVLLRF